MPFLPDDVQAILDEAHAIVKAELKKREKDKAANRKRWTWMWDQMEAQMRTNLIPIPGVRPYAAYFTRNNDRPPRSGHNEEVDVEMVNIHIPGLTREIRFWTWMDGANLSRISSFHVPTGIKGEYYPTLAEAIIAAL